MEDPVMQILVAKWLVATVLVFAGLTFQDMMSDWKHDKSNPFG